MRLMLIWYLLCLCFVMWGSSRLGWGEAFRPALCFFAKILDRVRRHIKAMCLDLSTMPRCFMTTFGSESCRGRPTAHHLWAEGHSILTGDFLLCKALQLLTEIENWAAVHLVHRRQRSVEDKPWR